MKALTCITWIEKSFKEWTPKLIDQEIVPLNNNKNNEEDEETARIIKDYGLDDYSDDEIEATTSGNAFADLAFYNKNQKDPYLVGSDDEDDEEEMKILADDNILVVGKADRDIYSMEMWVYNEKQKSFYCHHDYILSSCPLAMERVGGALVAQGDFNGDINIWDLTLINCLDPVNILASSSTTKTKKKKKNKENTPTGHTDAILGLTHNSTQDHLLASCSADCMIAIWDISKQNPFCSFVNKKQEQKVQDIQWHPQESQMLLIACADHTSQVFDCRASNKSVKTWNLSAEVEKILWNTDQPYCFFSGLSNGQVCSLDIRQDKVLHKVEAHEGVVTDLTYIPYDVCRNTANNKKTNEVNSSESNDVLGCLVTSSDDGLVKLWSGEGLKGMGERELKGGEVYCVGACPDSAAPLVAVAMETEVKVLDLRKFAEFTSVYGGEIVADDDSDFCLSDDEEDDNEKEEVGKKIKSKKTNEKDVVKTKVKTTKSKLKNGEKTEKSKNLKKKVKKNNKTKTE